MYGFLWLYRTHLTTHVVDVVPHTHKETALPHAHVRQVLSRPAAGGTLEDEASVPAAELAVAVHWPVPLVRGRPLRVRSVTELKEGEIGEPMDIKHICARVPVVDHPRRWNVEARRDLHAAGFAV